MAAPPAALALVGLALVATASAATGAAPAPAPCFIDPVWTVPEIVNVSGCTGGSSRCAWTVPANRTNIQYGSAYNRGKRKQEPLLLDLYLPPSTDTRTKRPGFVFIHGGGFTGGDKARHGAGPGVEAYMAAALAQRGFVTVSINYRLATPRNPQWGSKGGVSQTNDSYVIDAVHDLKAAIRFMRRNADAWRIDPNYIGAGGESAGGISVEFLGFVPVSEGDSGNPGISDNVSVILPISGALAFDTACSLPSGASKVICNGTNPPGTWNYTSDIGRVAGQPPVVMVHGTHDTVVPYRESVAVQRLAAAHNIPSLLVSVPGAGHVPYTQLLGIAASAPAVLSGSGYMTDTMKFIHTAMHLQALQCPKR
jgi:acetyl esterase/lipase